MNKDGTNAEPYTANPFLVLQSQRDLMRRNRTLTQDHPRTAAARKIDNGRRHGARGGATIDNQRDLVA